MERPSALTANRAMSRLEARLALELAVERRYPRVISRKPIFAGAPLGPCPDCGRRAV